MPYYFFFVSVTFSLSFFHFFWSLFWYKLWETSKIYFLLTTPYYFFFVSVTFSLSFLRSLFWTCFKYFWHGDIIYLSLFSFVYWLSFFFFQVSLSKFVSVTFYHIFFLSLFDLFWFCIVSFDSVARYFVIKLIEDYQKKPNQKQTCPIESGNNIFLKNEVTSHEQCWVLHIDLL